MVYKEKVQCLYIRLIYLRFYLYEYNYLNKISALTWEVDLPRPLKCYHPHHFKISRHL